MTPHHDSSMRFLSLQRYTCLYLTGAPIHHVMPC